MGTRTETASGSGPVNALCKAIDRITGFNGNLAYYSARATARGRDAVVAVFLKAEFGNSSYLGMAADADIIHASARGYLSAVNSHLRVDAARIEMLEFEALTARAGDNARVDDWV
jgi:2-isopropylmalate synthase